MSLIIILEKNKLKNKNIYSLLMKLISFLVKTLLAKAIMLHYSILNQKLQIFLKESGATDKIP